MNVKRYDWEDALIKAESHNLLEAGAVNMCLRLASAINWDSKGRHAGKPSGLYWKNEVALTAVGSSRATYFRYRRQLFDVGFLTEEKGNLIPVVPDLSQVETTESHIETDESQVETDQSQVDTPYSEDTYSEDELSEESLSVEAPVDADASPVSSNYSYMGSLNLEDFEDFSNSRETLSLDYLANSEGVAVFDKVGNEVEKAPQSQIETIRFLSPGEQKDFDRLVQVHRVSEENARAALAVIKTGPHTQDFYTTAVEALHSVGAVSQELVEAW